MDNNFFNKKTILTIIGIIVIYLLISNSSFLDALSNAIYPLFFAFFIAFILDRLVIFIENKTGIPRYLSLAITVLSIISIIVILFAIAVPKLIDKILSLINEFSDINNYELPLQFIGDIQNKYLIEINRYINTFIEDIVSKFSIIGGQVLDQIVTQIFRLTSGMLKFILSFVIAVYMLIDKNDLKIKIKRFNYAFLPQEKAEYMVGVVRRANQIFSSFFVGKLIDSTIIGVLFYIMALLFQLPYPIISALIVGITNMIPYIGPFIGAIPVSIIILVVSPYQFILTILIIILLQQLDGLVLGPLILGDKLNVSAFWIIIAVTIGGALKGFLGMLFGVPILVLLKSLIEDSVNTRLKDKNLDHIDGTQINSNNREFLISKLVNSFKKILNEK